MSERRRYPQNVKKNFGLWSQDVTSYACVKSARRYDSVSYNSRGDDMPLQVGGDVTMSRCALACWSPSLHTYRPASSTRARLTIRSRRPPSADLISNLRSSIPDILRPPRNSSTRPSSANLVHEPFERSPSEELQPMTTSLPTSTAMLRGRVVSFVIDGRRINSRVTTAIGIINRAILLEDFIFAL